MKPLLLSIILCTLCLNSSAQSKMAKHIAQQTIQGFFDAFSQGDLQEMNEWITDDIIILENGQIWNADTLATFVVEIKSKRDFKRINKFDFIKTEILENTAWTSYHNQAIITSGSKQVEVNWIESAVLVKVKGGWKIQMLHSTRL